MTFLETTIALIILRCDNYLEQNGVERSFKQFPALRRIVSELNEEDLKIWTLHFQDQISDGEDFMDIQLLRYRNALQMLGGSAVMQSFLDLSIALFSFPEFGAYLTEYFGYSVNIHLACLLEDIEFPSVEELKNYEAYAEKICYVDRTASPLQYSELTLDDRFMEYLLGSDEISSLLSGFTVLFDPEREGENLHEPFVSKELIDTGTDFFKAASGEGRGRILQLSGKGGRRFLARHVAKRLNRRFLFLNISDFFREAGKDRLNLLLSALCREAVLNKAGICFFGITDSFLNGRNGENQNLMRDLELLERIIFKPLLDSGILLILCTDEKNVLAPSVPAGDYLLAELPAQTDYESRKKLWEGFASVYGLKLDAERFAMHYRLNASEISFMIRGFIERRPGVTEIGEEEETLFAKLCMQRAEAEEGKNVGRVIYSSLKLNDVKVKPAIRAVLNDAVEAIRKSAMILDTWGLRQNYPYGRSVSLLLSGPPGTGKTMTANAIAGELSLPLYQVNLSNIVDKYIGETEKNLEKAFLFAEKTDAVLFFDEADSLFGTRSEVHDAKDRYANNEISYLLQRIEAYDGIVVMATNIKSNIDPAFLRRIRYVIHYENPDEGLRREIWEGCLTEGLPHKEIDIDYLAAQFDTFTGSIIKTVFLNACAYAAGREETLGMPHLIHAIRLELEKTSTVAFSGDKLGKYAYLS